MSAKIPHIEIIDHLDQWAKAILAESDAKQMAIKTAEIRNPWFTKRECDRMLSSIAEEFLTREKTKNWLDHYDIGAISKIKTVGIIAAGNIPLVCFHDILCALVLGHKVKLKLSEKDNSLPVWIINLLQNIDRALLHQISFVERLKDIDLIIATGSDMASQSFKKYFNPYPNIIRSHRNSVAILHGDESQEEIIAIGHDLLDYYGLGCRNISKLYVPEFFDYKQFLGILENNFSYVMENQKYYNNFEYNFALAMLNKKEFYQSNNLLLIKSNQISSRIASVNFEKYSKLDIAIQDIIQNKDKIQTVVSKKPIYPLMHTPPGKSQWPKLNQYADDVDTIEFLINNSK